MSTEQQNLGHGGGDPKNETVSFEPRDVQVRTIYWYLISLAIATVLAFASAVVILRVTTNMVAGSDAPMMPMRKMMTHQQQMESTLPPEPRLQGVPGHENDAQQDLREKVRADNQANEQLRWVDQNSGIAQIPVSEAMKLIVEKGVRGPTPAAKTAEAAKPAAASAEASAEKKN
jgi:hypothetical protein